MGVRAFGFLGLGFRAWGIVEGLVKSPARVQKIQGGPKIDGAGLKISHCRKYRSR